MWLGWLVTLNSLDDRPKLSASLPATARRLLFTEKDFKAPGSQNHFWVGTWVGSGILCDWCWSKTSLSIGIPRVALRQVTMSTQNFRWPSLSRWRRSLFLRLQCLFSTALASTSVWLERVTLTAVPCVHYITMSGFEGCNALCILWALQVQDLEWRTYQGSHSEAHRTSTKCWCAKWPKCTRYCTLSDETLYHGNTIPGNR